MSERLPEGTRVKSVTDGQIGHVVKTTSGLAIRLDRKAQEVIVPYDIHRWVHMDEVALTNYQVARVAYAADRALRQARGTYKVADWESLREAEKLDFIAKGPQSLDEDDALEERMELFVKVVKTLHGK